jgi:hypothetical protein
MSGGVIANCIVRDLSESGARLGVWQRGDYVGVSFCLEEQVAKLVRANSRKHFILKA